MKPFARLVEFADEKTQRLDRSAQHIRRAPAPDHISTRKLYGEARERIRPFLRLIGDRTSFAEEIRAMEAKSRDSVRCAKCPARKKSSARFRTRERPSRRNRAVRPHPCPDAAPWRYAMRFRARSAVPRDPPGKKIRRSPQD